MSFASKLQTLRQEYGISQEELAEMLNVSRQSVSKWERGKGYPEIEKLIHISERFNISLDDLLKDRKGNSGRQPISLTKDSGETSPDIRTAYPVNSSDEEIYPQIQTAPDAAADSFFNTAVVSENAGLGQYGNYSTNSSQPVNGNRKIRRRFRFFRKKLSTAEFILFTVILSVITILIISGILMTVSHPDYSESYVYTDDFTASEELPIWDFNTEFYIDEDAETFYVINADSYYGIVDELYSSDINEYIKVKNIETDEELYIYNWYYYDNCIVSRDNYFYVLPEYMTVQSVSKEMQPQYELLSWVRGGDDSDTNSLACFIPKSLFEKADNYLSGMKKWPANGNEKDEET